MEFKSPFKLGIYINQNSLAGGGFYESLSTVKLFNTDQFEIIYFTSNKTCLSELVNLGFNTKFIKINTLDRFILFFRRFLLNISASVTPGNVTPTKLIKKVLPRYNRFEKRFIDNHIDLIYFVSPEVNCIFLEKLNYIITVWDLAHNNIAYFPELREDHVFETREIFYQNVLPKAYGIVVAHNLTKELMIKKYLQPENKIFKVPFKPSQKIIEQENQFHSSLTLKLNNLPKKYIYYPAQYAAHKNHRILIDTVELLKKKKLNDFGIVFSGTDRGNLSFLKEVVRQKKLMDSVFFLPFVSDEEVFQIFKNSFALVMPSYLGPGTLPSMEAMFIKVPLILPNFLFNIEFYGESSLYYDFDDIDDLSEKIIKLNKSKELREKLISNAKQKYDLIMDSNENKELINHIKAYSSIITSYKY